MSTYVQNGEWDLKGHHQPCFKSISTSLSFSRGILTNCLNIESTTGFYPKEGIGCIIVPNFNFTTIIVTLDLSTIALLHNGCVQHYIFTRILMSDGFCLQQCAGATFASLAAWAYLARPRLGPTWLPSQIYQCSVKFFILRHKRISPSYIKTGR